MNGNQNDPDPSYPTKQPATDPLAGDGAPDEDDAPQSERAAEEEALDDERPAP
jgi:hypothetical protein